ncbi:hypothetical protein [Pseudomonas graminis]|uniref:Uncharacterized protein n=1 Tax=Pseudomonas graminis TaxID=158627 RepID=A0A1I0J138_9PSED|nr:hypothetical protein [Pseudomonas graminis]SEU03341.1 hypothetical protein SAMN05216197_14539 [Pseudomonas graminis]
MPWYKAGTVSVAQNSNAVTGTGTSFITNSRVGDAFLGPDGRWYEVTNIASDTAMAISPNYLGAAANAGTYALAPMQGYVKDSADALRALVNQFGEKLAALRTTGNYDVLPINKGGTGKATAPEALDALGGIPKAGGAYSPTFVSLRLSGPAVYSAGQGAYTGWNDPNDGSGFNGHVAFTCNRGGGSGGFSWRSVVTDNTSGGPTMTYSYDGILNVPGTVRIGGSDIVARGNTATGEWTRFSDGTQICTLAVQTDSMGTYAVGALFGSNAAGNLSYPAAFLITPKVTATAVKVGGGSVDSCFVSNYQAPTVTAWGSWRALSTNNAAVAAIINLTAVGRWK